MTDPLSYLRGVKAHVCGGDCPHNSGINTEKKVAPESNSPPEPSGGSAGMGPDGGDPLSEDSPCEDCGLTLREHEGITASGDRSCSWNSCKRWVPVTPKT